MDTIEQAAALEGNETLHEARILILLGAFKGDIEGITKLAKLDFLLRYPTYLERALKAKGQPPERVGTTDHERISVESKMVRYRFGPWDHRYRRLLNRLVGRGLIRVSVQGRTIAIALSDKGAEAAQTLAKEEANADIKRRASILRTHFDVSGSYLMRFIYDHFPEVTSLRSNDPIGL